MTTMLTIMLTTIAVLSLVINAVQHAKSKSNREYTRKLGVEYDKVLKENASLEVLLKVEQVETRQCRESLKIAEQSGKDCEDCADSEPDEAQAKK